MKTFFSAILLATLCLKLMAQTNSPVPALPAKLSFAVHDWATLKPEVIPNGVRRLVFDGPTATVDKLHCHITTLNPGEVSGEPRLHLQDEVIIVKEGTVEAISDGKVEPAGPGSVIFFPSQAVTQLRNPGEVPATYTVVYYFTPLTPKH